jgi:hypothetical protein
MKQTILLTTILTVVGAGIYYGHTSIMQWLDELDTPTVVMQQTPDDIQIQLDQVRDLVEKTIRAKEQVNKNRALMERAQNTMIDATDLYNESVRNLNTHIDTLELFGGGALEIYYTTSQARGLYASSTIN